MTSFLAILEDDVNCFLLYISPTDVAGGKLLLGDVLGLLQSVRGERVRQEGVSRLSVGGSVRTRA